MASNCPWAEPACPGIASRLGNEVFALASRGAVTLTADGAVNSRAVDHDADGVFHVTAGQALGGNAMLG